MDGELGRSVTHVFHLAFSGEVFTHQYRGATCSAQPWTHCRSSRDDLHEKL